MTTDGYSDIFAPLESQKTFSNYVLFCFKITDGGFNNSSFHALLIHLIKELYKIFASKYAPQSKFLEGIFLSVKFGAHSEGVTKTP